MVERSLIRVPQVARNVALLAGTAVRHLLDDPLLLAVQGARRLPVRWRTPLATLVAVGTSEVRPTVRRVFSEFIADRPARAASLAERCAPTTRLGTRFLAELAVHLGLPLPAEAQPITRAREAWNRGDISGAIAVARSGKRGRGYATRLASERLTMQPGFRLHARKVVSSHSDADTGSLRVSHVLTNSVPHTHSGYAVRSHEILRAQRAAGIDARALTRIGYPVTVGLPTARVLDVVDGVPYQRLLPARLSSNPAGRLQQMVDAALPIVRQHRPHVLHTTTNFTNALVTEALARSLGVPWVYEVRGVLEETWLASRHPAVRAEAATSERYRLLQAREAELMRAADHVVALSEVSRQNLLERGIPAEQVTVVPNAVDANLLEQDVRSVEARERLGLPLEGVWVGSVSSLVDYEGFDILLHAVALVRGQGIDVRVALAGDGVARPALTRLATSLGLAPFVSFPGRVAREDAWLWHRALDVFVVPRRDLQVCREVTPLKPIEAMAAGRPVIASDLPALREIVVDPGSGAVVPPEQPDALASTLTRLLESAELRDSYGMAGRRFATGRTWAQNTEIYRKVYQQVGVEG